MYRNDLGGRIYPLKHVETPRAEITGSVPGNDHRRERGTVLSVPGRPWPWGVDQNWGIQKGNMFFFIEELLPKQHEFYSIIRSSNTNGYQWQSL